MSRTAVRTMVASIIVSAAVTSPAPAQTDATPRYAVNRSSSQVGFTLMAARGVTSQHALPLGTFLGLAGIAVVFVGDPFLAWYRGLLGA